LNEHLISLMVFIPLLGALCQAFLPRMSVGGKGPARDLVGRWTALGASLLASVCAIFLVATMRLHSEIQAHEIFSWVGSYAISYDMGVDGLNALLILLVAVIFPVLIAAEWDQKTVPRGMHSLLLVLQTTLFGAVCAQDIFLQFFFFGMSALPFYFLIGIWGGEGREQAAFRLIVSSSLGNALIFAALLIVYHAIDPHSFSLKELAGGRLSGKMFEVAGYELSLPALAFGLVGAGLALRAPIWPFHGWFTQVAQEAPPSVFVALSAVTVPVASYVFIRLTYTLFPETLAAVAPVIMTVGMINLVAGGVCAVAQKSLRLLLAFICIGEVGLILVGLGSLNPAGVVGAVYQHLVLGLGLAGFGLFSGLVNQRVGHASFLPEEGDKRPLGGIAVQAPAVAVVAGVIVASLLGFPGSGGFVGHALVILGSYSTHPLAALVAAAAFLLATYYLFTMYRCVFLGSGGAATASFPDLTLRERVYLMPVVACLLLFGLYPKPLLELVRPTVLTLLSTIK
jgi:NADH-quinone oxidoreductase subunit M